MPPGPQAFGDRLSAPSTPYKTLYRFTGAPHGSGPAGYLVYNSLLYGTTIGGGSKSFGTVFVRGLNGKVRILHSFQGGADGASPSGPLVELGDVLYGTTEYGGNDGDGIVFSITTSGKTRILYSFKGGSDGANPVLAGLLAVHGKLYGTTNAGGESKCHQEGVVGCGTVFVVSTAGHERVLHRFKGKPDGANPAGSLVDSGGTLYGTTNFGGAFDTGSVYTITTAGKEHVLYSFKGYPDGAMPNAGLTEYNGSFYGTTTLGGAYQGAGTVYKVSSAGDEHVLHSFKGAPDGALPYAPLVESNGVLYGTTEDGGSAKVTCLGHGIVGCGTIFSITTAGDQQVIHRFRGHDGAYPLSGLVVDKTEFEGGAFAGGSHNNGTLFEIAP